jgi:integrase/recombinase XerD
MELVPIEKLSIMPTDRVMEYFLSQQTEGTARTYSAALRAFFIWAKKGYKEVTPFDAMDYSKQLENSSAPATVQRHISTLNRFFRFAKECGLIDGNPFAVVRQKSVPITSQNKFLTVKELDRLLNALAEKSEKHYVLGLLLAATGMRISEVQQLSWNSFLELPDGTIAINALRKGGNYQILPLRNDVWDVLRAFTGKEIDPGDNSPIFLNPSGERATGESLRKWIRDGAKRAKIKKAVSPHTLRHTFCSLSISGGASIRDVQEYAGHKRISTTERYLHAQNMKVGEFMPIKIEQ